MASFHLAVKAISRSVGRSATAAAAYRAGVEITDERTGLVHDYTRKSGIVHCEIILPAGAPAWAQDRAMLWNAAELAERRKDAKVAREYEIALPAELSGEARLGLAREFAAEISARYGVAVDISVHAPGREGDQRNHHAHLLTTTRRVGTEGLGEKTRELDVKVSAATEVEQLRERWAALQNHALERAGHETVLDHRSYQRQGLDLEPTIHMGPAASNMERKAEWRAMREERDYNPVTEVGQHNAAVLEKRSLRTYIELGTQWLREARQQAQEFGRKLYDFAAGLGGAIDRDRQAAAEAERVRKDQERHAIIERERAEQQRQQAARLAAKAARQAEIAREEAHARAKVAERFEKIAANRKTGAYGYGDEGSDWRAAPEQLRKVVEGYNAAPQQAKDIFLERIRSEPQLAKGVGQLIDRQQQELALEREIYRQRDRGMER